MSISDQPTVVGVFTEQSMAEHAISALQQAGFNDQQIGYVARDVNATADEEITESADTGAGAATGAVTGGVIGGLLGAVGALLIPGLGPILAGGIVIAAIGGAAVGAAAGGLFGVLTHMGIPEEDARYYQSEFEAGHTIVTVQSPERAQEALAILRQYGAYDALTRPASAHFETTSPDTELTNSAGSTAYRPNTSGSTEKEL